MNHLAGFPKSGPQSQRRFDAVGSSRVGRRPLRCLASKNLTGQCIVKMSGQCSDSCKVEQRHEPGSTLQEYMTHAGKAQWLLTAF